MDISKICMVGLGYIGLPTASVIASRKCNVIGLDVDPDVVDTINKGDIHIVEPDLDMIVHAAVSEGYLRATLKAEPAEAFLVAVPTPFKTEAGKTHVPDLKYIESAAKSIAPVLERGNLVILESTSPVGTTEQFAAWLAEARPDLTFPQTDGEESDIRIAHCPERVLPGHVIRELVANDRVIGGLTPACSEAAFRLYEIFVEGECITTTARTAEMAKLTENSFRDVNIAFANELSLICDKLDIDVWELIELANRHPRVNILKPGPGVGGHCIAVDPWFIVSETPEQARLIRMAREVNDAKPQWVIDKVKSAIGQFLQQHFDHTAKDVKVALFGLAFKPDIDDLRESPALAIAVELEQSLAGSLMVVEPNIEVAPAGLARASLVSSDEAIEQADICVIMVAHREFKGLDFSGKLDEFVIDVVASGRA
ncbi:UDP-N-acetyl-D-mannosamine dehydrogenase [Marinobacter maritimus]|uniref:UDP-N-acetyl-D-mannosamine dehydrogenase n=1 Tax=Marinobacter maritimus TaxID=277961 RepID=UPI00119EA765|nr:UDP-N-acetyl-D-mannosamine dehydrogenase [Marinobacter maritimus]